MHRVNYDDIAHLYDEPIRDHKTDLNLLDFLASNPGLKEADVTILDIGCGTGRQLAANRKRFPRMGMVGADRFRGMLRIAGELCSTVGWVQADGALLPFGTASLHYATNQFSYQHIRNTERLLGELYRVLKPGGRFVMTNIDPWSMTDWIIYRHFPEALEMDYRDFLPIERFVDLMESTGFSAVHATPTCLSKREQLREFLAFARDRHRASQLMAIPDEAYETGIEKLERRVANLEGSDAIVEYDFVLVTVSGEKPRATFGG